MIGFHCKIAVDALHYEIFSFSTIELTFLILRGWIHGKEQCLPGGWM